MVDENEKKCLPERKRNGTEPGSLKNANKNRDLSRFVFLDTISLAPHSFTALTGCHLLQKSSASFHAMPSTF